MMMGLFVLTGCAGGQPTWDDEEPEANGSEINESSEISDFEVRTFDVNPIVAIEIQGHGTIEVELKPEYAPITVTNFINLVEEGFYDGLTFHRIIEGFMIQGGDPAGNGTGGSDQMIPGEFANNGIENPLRHERGVISMARQGHDNNSASSQFFIMHQNTPFLDDDYAAFGTVISGMEIVDTLANTPAQPQSGTVEPADQPMMTSIRVIN